MRRAQRLEFGDWQTPPELARAALACVARHVRQVPSFVVEPTCGQGAFLSAAHARFPEAQLFGFDVDAAHLSQARRALAGTGATLRRADFFSLDWGKVLARLLGRQGETGPGPLWLVGNPPWVTTSRQGALGSDNAPTRVNRLALPGLDALTGKGNFDISEAMLLRLLEALRGRDATVAVLLKTQVARKLVAFLEGSGHAVQPVGLFRVDAGRHFDAAVDAVLFACRLGRRPRGPLAWPVFTSLDARRPSSRWGVVGGRVVPDVEACQQTARFLGASPVPWRSGLKHDCAKVVELSADEHGLRNGLGEAVDLEPDCLYPLMKSSDVARGEGAITRWMLVPTRSLDAPTDHLRTTAPRTWAYLHRHRAAFVRRQSSIYRGRDAFAVFGVGPYTFAPWKVAISGLYKHLGFRLVGPVAGRPVVFDDTCYLLPFETKAEAQRAFDALSSPQARAFFEARLFWDAKRPITRDLLQAFDWSLL